MFHKIVNLIKINLKFNNKFIKTNLNSSDIIILKIFLKLNIIKYIKFLKTNKKLKKSNNFLISLNNNTNLTNLINLYKPSKITTINNKNLIKINKKKINIFYISTNKGVINNIEAEKYKIGGILIFKIWL